jgi:glycosyltransferase involved in cell wall biosynthesis
MRRPFALEQRPNLLQTVDDSGNRRLRMLKIHADGPAGKVSILGDTDSGMKKNLFILIPNLGGGGAERVITTITRHLNRDLWSITLIVVQDNDSVYRSSIPNDISYINLRSSRVRYALPKIISMLWLRRPDIVFSTLGHLNLALAMVRKILPKKITFIARESSIVSYMNMHHRYPSLLSWLYRKFYSNFDILVSQSNLMATDLIDNFNVPERKVKIIHNPVDILRVRNLSTSLTNADDAINNWRNYSGVKLLSVGRMSPEKGFDILIKSIHQCRDLPLRLLILGSGPMFDQLSEMVLRLNISNIITIHEFIENPYPLMAVADAFVLSSHFEGFPNAVLEAVTLGTPIISTPAPGGLFDIIHNIEGCHIASEINSDSLAKELRSWCSSSQKRLPFDCTSHFNAAEIVKKYEAVFLGL